MQTVFLPTKEALAALLPDALGVQKIPGIGFASTQRCHELGVTCLKDARGGGGGGKGRGDWPTSLGLFLRRFAGTAAFFSWRVLGKDRSSAKNTWAPAIFGWVFREGKVHRPSILRPLPCN